MLAKTLARDLAGAGVEFTEGDQSGARLRKERIRPRSIATADLNTSNDEQQRQLTDLPARR
jgi:hypothetical protein